MPSDKVSFVEETRTKYTKRMRSQSNADHVFVIGSNLVRGAHAAHVLVRQRNIVFADAKPLTPQGNVLFGLTLAINAFNVFMANKELRRRTRPNQAPRQVDEEDKELDVQLIAAYTVDVGLSLRAAATGQVAFKKRPLTQYGRAHKVLTATMIATKIGIMIRESAR